MATRTTPSGHVLTTDKHPPRPRNAVLADLIADRIYLLAGKTDRMSGDLNVTELAPAIERMLDEGTLLATLEGE